MTTEQATTETTAADAATDNAEATENTEAQAKPEADADADGSHDAKKPLLAEDGEASETQEDGDEDKSEDKSEEPDGPPEKYEFQMPEGVEPDEKLTEEWSETFRDAGLSQEQAQKLVDKFAAQQMAQAQEQVDLLGKFADEVKQSDDFGGPDMPKKLQTAQKVIKEFGTDRFRGEILESYVGNHIEMIRFLDKVGKELAKAGRLGEDDTHIPAGGASGNAEEAKLRKMYPNTRA